MRAVVLCAAGLLAALTFANELRAEPRPQTVLVLLQPDARAPFPASVLAGFQRAIESKSPEPVTIYLEYLDRNRFVTPGYQEALRNYLSSKYREIPLDVIVGFGASTLEFVSPLHESPWSDVPMVFGQIDEATFRNLTPRPNTTGHLIQLTLAQMISVAQTVVPDLKSIVLVGSSWDSQLVFRYFKDQIPQVPPHLAVVDLTGLPLSELLARLATLPEHSAILYTALNSDGRGTILTSTEAVKIIAEKANRPIVVAAETFVGTGAIGGPALMAEPIGESAAGLVLRILNGESAQDIPVTKADVVRTLFDARQLERWGVNESILPPGSEVRFRPVIKQFYREIIAYGTLLLLALCGLLLSVYEYKRRRNAENDARQRMSELALVNRQATAGEMSAAIAHELNQPLGTILNDAEAAQLILNSKTPDLAELRILLNDIRNSDHRASEIIKHLRALMSKNKSDLRPIDLNEVAREAVEIGKIQANASNVTLHMALAARPLQVRGDRIQLQQVFLNLVMNGIEAVKGRPTGRRDIVISTAEAERNWVEVSVSDSGPGISNDNMEQIFNPFFSTKENGMGVGLSLCRTIVEAHNGAIHVENGFAGGAVFRFQLPRTGRSAVS